MENKEVIIITGISGGGKTTALNILEDLDYYTIDNIPLGLEEHLLNSNINKLAVGIDIRTFKKSKDFFKWADKMNELNIKFTIIYLDAEENVILGRYNLTRRLHPIKSKSILESIKLEKSIMEEIKEKAHYVIDTSRLRGIDLEKKIKEILEINKFTSYVNIHLQSFGFKYGIPLDADLIFDARIISNPYYIKDLKEKNGLDKEVKDYIMQHENSQKFYKKLLDFISFLIPEYINEGKKHITIAIGCTGGQHRSVALVELLSNDLKYFENTYIYVLHREKSLGHW